MCLGIPGQVLAFSDDSDQLATVAVTGVPRTINIGLVRDEGLDIGDWVLLHVGFALEIISEQEATEAMQGLQLLGSGFPDDGLGSP